MKKYYYLLSVLLLLLITPTIKANDSKGTEFWLSFMPNYHNNVEASDPAIKYGDSLYIFINAEQVTTGKITYRDRYGIESIENFSITNPDELYTFRVSYYDYEIWGYNYHGNSWSKFQTEKIAPQSFHIETDEEVTVYAHTQAVTTSDAFIVLPADVLSTEYYVMSYNSDGRTTINEESRTPSQFVVVATQDNTNIEITTTVDTYLRPAGQRTIILNRGDAYLLQAKFDKGIQNPDLTGSYVLADKPVAVFGGHQRSLIPVSNEDGTSRDCLVEHIPPTTTWGKNAFIIPPEEPKDVNSTKGSLYRILASQDSTVVRVNGILINTMDRGDYFEDFLTSPSEIVASKPVLVGVFKFTAGRKDISLPLGDPFMMLIPPKEQFISKCKIINVQAWEKNAGDNRYYPVYSEQYITLVTPESALDSIYVDGVQILSGEFEEIQGSGYFYSNIAVEAGVHDIIAKEPMGVFIYGYGKANSYGYTGGMGLKVINFEPPRFTSIDTCFKISGQVFTSDSANRYLVDVKQIQDSTQNVTVNIGDFLNKYRTDFDIELNNTRFDGKAILSAEDNARRISEKTYEIPGLTIAYEGYTGNDTLPVLLVNALPTGMIKIPINNYGKFNKKLIAFEIVQDTVGKILSSPDNIEAMSIDSVVIEYELQDKYPRDDTLFVITKCGKAAIAVIHIIASDCDPSAFEFTEFKDKTLLRLNGKARLSGGFARIASSDAYQSGTMWYHETVPVLDGFTTSFQFRLTDGHNYDCDDGSDPGADGLAFVIQNAGNAALGFPGGGIGYEGIFNSLAVEFDTYANDNQQIENYYDPNGNHIAIQSLGINRNTSKHLDTAMLYMNDNVLPMRADSTVFYVTISYNLKKRTLVVMLDTVENPENEVVRLEDFSIGDYLSLDRGYRAYVGFTAATGCAMENHDILSWSFCPEFPNPATDYKEREPNRVNNDMLVKPNPFSSHSEITFTLTKDDFVTLSVIDLLGNTIAVLNTGMLQAGNHSFIWEPKSLDRGIYFIRLVKSTEQIIKKAVFTY